MPVTHPSLSVQGRDLTMLTEMASLPERVAQRAHIVLLAAQGLSTSAIAVRVGVSPKTVVLWRARYAEGGLGALVDRPRPGRPQRLDPRMILSATLEPPPRVLDATHWSARLLAGHLGVGHGTVARAWSAYGVWPRGAGTYRFATTPTLTAHVTDVVGLVLAPGLRMIALHTYEAGSPSGNDRHEHRDAATPTGMAPISLYAALRAAMDDPDAHEQRPGPGLDSFLRRVGDIPTAGEPLRPDLALVTDHPTAPDLQMVHQRLSPGSRARIHRTTAVEPWLNLVEAFLTIVEVPATRRGAAGCVPELDELIRTVVAGTSPLRRPFVWTASGRPTRPRR